MLNEISAENRNLPRCKSIASFSFCDMILTNFFIFICFASPQTEMDGDADGRSWDGFQWLWHSFLFQAFCKMFLHSWGLSTDLIFANFALIGRYFLLISYGVEMIPNNILESSSFIFQFGSRWKYFGFASCRFFILQIRFAYKKCQILGATYAFHIEGLLHADGDDVLFSSTSQIGSEVGSWDHSASKLLIELFASS